MTRFSLLLADADNTLLDFDAAERAAFFDLCGQLGFQADEAAFALYRRINKNHWDLLHGGQTTSARLRVARFEDFAAEVGLAGADGRHMSDLFVAALGQHNLLMAGAERFVKRVSRHMPVCIVTNSFAAVQQARFAHSPLRPYLTELFISENFAHAKPHPEMIITAMERQGITDKARVVMIGDNEDTDIAAAENAGIQSIIFTGGGPAPAATRATLIAQTLEEAGDWILDEQ